MSSRLAAVAETSGEFRKVNALVVIRIHSAKDGGHALSIPARKRGQGRKFVSIETAVFACDLRKLLLALGLKGVPAGFTSGFLLLPGEFPIAICIEFSDVGSTAFGPGGAAGFLGGLTLLFVDFSIFVEVELFKNLGELSITKGAIASGIGKPDADGDGGNGEIF